MVKIGELLAGTKSLLAGKKITVAAAGAMIEKYRDKHWGLEWTTY
jgi:hypothetical protein